MRRRSVRICRPIPPRRSSRSGAHAIVWRALLAVLVLHARPAAALPAPLAAWTFDASSLADSSGHGLTLTTQGVTSFIAGPKNTALQLGVLGYGERAYTPLLTPGTRSWSVSLWVRTATDTSDSRAMLSWYRCGANAACSSPDAADYIFSIYKDDQPHWEVRGDNAAEFDLRTHRSISDMKWHHLVGTFAFTTHLAELYLDGARVDTGSALINGLSDGGFPIPLSVGRLFRTGWGVPGNYLGGALDEIRIFDQALSAAEVLALYHASPLAGVGRGASPAVALGAARPNPFRLRTTIPFTLPGMAALRLSIHHVAGREVAVIAEGRWPAGSHTVTWDGSDARGRVVRDGVYFYRLRVRPDDGGAERVLTQGGTLIR